MATSDDPALPACPEDLEARAAEILLGPPDRLAERFEALCAANAAFRPALCRLRDDFERAARALDGTEPAWPSPPRTIGPYRVGRLLGEGAFGTVFLAEQDEPIRRQLAVKLLHAPAASAATVARFLNERETLSRMNHSSIARIHDAGIDEVGRPWIAMEYVAGQPLHRHAEARDLDLEARIDLFLAACDGVQHAHQRGVIHRDLKPQNILVGDVDGRPRPKVIDFGLAKAIGDDVVSPLRTQAGAVLGTPAYMSREQIRGDVHEVDVRTDVYALGVILYELLTGTLPVSSDECRALPFAELQRRIAEVDAPLASQRAHETGRAWARSLRGDLDWILRKAMAKDKDERYATVAEFAADLRRHLGDEPVAAGPPSTRYVVRKFVQRNRLGVAFGALLLASLTAGLLVSSALYRQARANATEADERLRDFWRLADTIELDELTAEAATLWPASPERLDGYESWLRRASALIERRAAHAATARELAAAHGAGDGGGDPARARGERFLAGRLEKHLKALDAFAAATGLFRQVEARAEFARTVEARSIAEHRAAWNRVRAAVASSERYGRMQLAPIRGLVPLGPDPDSGLEEFAHLQSGRLPVRTDDGRLAIDEDAAIVLVLVPGGEFEVGSQNDAPGAAHYDPWRQVVETDLARTPCPAFLIGKYELTQAQVRTLGLALNAKSRLGATGIDGRVIGGRHPEESVLGPEVLRWLPWFELRLPHTHEWEIAARAGSPSVWGVGDRVEDLQGHANIADADLRETGIDLATDDRVRDGHLSHAPVGSFRANAFGLFDVLGNVAELTSATSEDGETVLLARGGSYMQPALGCRIGSLRLVMPNQASPELGLRVARSVDSSRGPDSTGSEGR